MELLSFLGNGVMKLKVVHWQKSFLILSILCHIFCFLIFLTVQYIFANKKEKSPAYEVASYLYEKAALNQTPTIPSPSYQQPIENKASDKKSVKSSPLGIEKPQFAEIKPVFDVEQYKAFVKAQAKEDPVHLIGEKMLEDPLLKLLGIAITKHLSYPEIAGKLYLHGVASISMLLYPDGHIAEIQLIKSSHEQMLDVAALNAINDASPVRNVDIYLHEPKHLVINVIFRGVPY